MRRLTWLVVLAALGASVVALVGPAAAGGSWFDTDQPRYEPGDEVSDVDPDDLHYLGPLGIHAATSGSPRYRLNITFTLPEDLVDGITVVGAAPDPEVVPSPPPRIGVSTPETDDDEPLRRPGRAGRGAGALILAGLAIIGVRKGRFDRIGRIGRIGRPRN